MNIWFKLAFREIINDWRFSLFFILNLSLGLVGFIALDSFKISIQDHINLRSKAILSADLDIRANRPLKEAELKQLEDVMGGYQGKTYQLNFLSMIASQKDSKLVQIVALGEGYPLYGSIVLDDGREITAKDKSLPIHQKPELWIQPELLVSLGIKLQDSLKLGAQDFIVQRTVIESPGISFWSAGIAYRVFIGMKQAEKTGLIRRGSRRSHHYLYKLPKNSDLKKISRNLKLLIQERYGDNPNVFIQTHQGSSQQINRTMGYLSDYLGLVSLVALFLAGIGTAYLFRGYLVGKVKELAILMCLGGKKSETYFMSFIQIGGLGLVSALIASLLSMLVIPVFPMILKNYLPSGFVGIINFKSVILALVIGVLGSVLFCLPVLAKVQGLKPKILLNQDLLNRGLDDNGKRWILLSYLPIIFGYWSLSIWQANSFKIGSIFMGSLLGSLLVLGLVGWGCLTLANRSVSSSGLRFKLVFRSLYRNKFAVLSSFLAIGVGSLLINLIPQIHQGLNEEISAGNQNKIPIFFLFDIQPEQAETLKIYLNQQKITLENLSLSVRARLFEINGVQYRRLAEKKALTREEQQQQHSRSHEYNLSFRLRINESERIIQGAPFERRFDPAKDKLPLVSLEERIAGRLGVQVGDNITFDIQGVPVKAKIHNLRKVRWNSFRPNFYILFQPGVIDDAPGTYLATINEIHLPNRIEFQNRLVREFPNISMVDVTVMIKKAVEITGQLSWALKVMALLAVLAGLIVVYSISRHNAQSRQQEVNLLKILGAVFQDIQIILLLEFAMLGFVAALVGTALSILISMLFAYLIFESLWSIDWFTATYTISLVTLLSMLTAYFGAKKTLSQKPLGLLRAL